MEERLHEMLTDLKGFMKEELGTVKVEISKVRTELGEEISKVRTELGEEISQVRTELGEEISQVRTELGHEISELGQQIVGLQVKVSNLTHDITEIKTDLADIHRKLDVLYVQVAANTENDIQMNEVVEKLHELETDVRIIKKIVANQ